MSLGNYREQVRELIRKREGTAIFNGSMDHAAIIMESLFENAERDISILSKNLNVDVYAREAVMDQARHFLTRPNCKLRILLEDDDKKYYRNHPFFRKVLGEEERPNVEVLRMPEDKQDKYDFHFAVMDDDSYRFESDKKEPAAIAAFGDVKGTARLRDIFEKMRDDARPLNLAA